MTTKKSTTQKSHISLQRAAELVQGIRDLRDKFDLLFARVHDHIEGHTEWYESNNDVIKALQDRVAFLTKQSSDAFCKADLSGEAIVNTREEMDKRSNATVEKFRQVTARLDAAESLWRQNAKVGMERYQEVRDLKATVRTHHESLHNHEKRLRELASEWVINKAATDYITNPTCRPRDPQWVVMGYNSERNKVEVHGPFTYPEAERFRNDADYSGYATLPLED